MCKSCDHLANHPLRQLVPQSVQHLVSESVLDVEADDGSGGVVERVGGVEDV
jgi:hypothetical protein